MKTKRIKSKKERFIHVLDLVVFLVCIFRCFGIIIFWGKTISAFKAFDFNFGMMLILLVYAIWISFIYIIIRNIFIIAIYLAYRIPRMRSLKKNSKYEVIDNIPYFRERFKSITPSEISLLTDLEIETKKDFSAYVLDLYNRKIIDFKNNKLVIKKHDENDLKESEKLLINILENKNYNALTIKTWKSLCEHEAIEDNLIVEKKNIRKSFGFLQRASVVVIWILVLNISLFTAFIYVNSNYFNNTEKNISKFQDMVDTDDEDEIIELIKSDEEAHDLAFKIFLGTLPLIIIITLILISVLALFTMPLYLGVRRITYRLVDKNNKYERTSEGKILVEQIAGMKSFIHDFSTLSEKEKESVILWNDFLVYAVLLEENEKIVKDIFRYRNADLSVLDYVDRNVSID